MLNFFGVQPMRDAEICFRAASDGPSVVRISFSHGQFVVISIYF
jgi:hypothetical protein